MAPLLGVDILKAPFADWIGHQDHGVVTNVSSNGEHAIEANKESRGPFGRRGTDCWRQRLLRYYSHLLHTSITVMQQRPYVQKLNFLLLTSHYLHLYLLSLPLPSAEPYTPPPNPFRLHSPACKRLSHPWSPSCTTLSSFLRFVLYPIVAPHYKQSLAVLRSFHLQQFHESFAGVLPSPPSGFRRIAQALSERALRGFARNCWADGGEVCCLVAEWPQLEEEGKQQVQRLGQEIATAVDERKREGRGVELVEGILEAEARHAERWKFAKGIMLRCLVFSLKWMVAREKKLNNRRQLLRAEKQKSFPLPFL
eukprot:GHVS01076627.1.p1 GENE.GHVS01076627.1~~GHVS01076627.1.p1  ORF type:complete len:324 (-),score=36.88 GHVS01076627.1:47-976(-)